MAEKGYDGIGQQWLLNLLEKNAVRFAHDPRPVWNVGLNINESRRTIGSYEVVACK